MRIELRVLAWTHVGLGSLGLLACLTVLSWLGRNPDHAHSQLLNILGPAAALAILAWFAPMVAGGVLMLRRKPLGRLLIWAESALLLALFPLGTALAGFGIWALMRPENRLPFQPVPRGFGKAVLAVLAALSILAVMLGIGYLFRDQLNERSITRPNATVPDFPLRQLPERPTP